jgi:hypothetical protein
MMRTALVGATALVGVLSLLGSATPAMAQPAGSFTVTQPDGADGFIPTSSPIVNLASDNEVGFVPFGLTGVSDVSDAIEFTAGPGVWVPDAAYASAFGSGLWTEQVVGTNDVWFLPASITGCGSENEPSCEPVAKWDFAPGSGWNDGTPNVNILNADGTLSDFVNVANDGVNGAATVTFVSDPTAVPEPSTWAMMLLGFAGLAFAGYRSRGRTAALAV